MVTGFHGDTCIVGNTIILNGTKLPHPPSNNTGCSKITVCNNKAFANGYEWKNGRWKRTLRALWYLWF